MPILYVVATPIGNLEDITLRALRVLREVDLIAAEDTRTTRKLLSHFDIHTPTTSYNDRNKTAKTPQILERLAEGNVALVSEAGTPGISDPGQDLVIAALEIGAEVVPIPGPSAMTAAVSASGIRARNLTYLGFLPRQGSARRRLLRSMRDRIDALVVFETPHRLPDALNDMLAELGDRPLAACRELTKLHEEIWRGTVSEALTHFTEPRGEFTLVIAGADAPQRDVIDDEAKATEKLRRLKREGKSAQEAMALLSPGSGLSRRRLYQLWLQIK